MIRINYFSDTAPVNFCWLISVKLVLSLMGNVLKKMIITFKTIIKT